jgi:hypothetical protein
VFSALPITALFLVCQGNGQSLIMVLYRSSPLLQCIPHPDDRMDQRRAEALIDLRAQVIDVNVDDVGALSIIGPPEAFRDMTPGKHPVLVDDQQFQEGKLLSR